MDGNRAGPGFGPAYPQRTGRKRLSGKNLAVVIVGCALLLLMCGGAIYGISNDLHKDIVPDDQLRTGTCVLPKGSSDHPELWHANCSDAGAYRITMRLDNTTKTDGCPQETERTYQQIGLSSGKPTFVLCLRRA